MNNVRGNGFSIGKYQRRYENDRTCHWTSSFLAKGL